MSKVKIVLGWIGIVFLGLFNGLLEDLLFLNVVVPYSPTSWDITGNGFFLLTVPLTQLMTLAITGTIAWFFLGLRQPRRLLTFWVCWTVSRAFFLNQFNNPPGDILIYLLWIAFWCGVIALLARAASTSQGIGPGARTTSS